MQFMQLASTAVSILQNIQSAEKGKGSWHPMLSAERQVCMRAACIFLKVTRGPKPRPLINMQQLRKQSALWS